MSSHYLWCGKGRKIRPDLSHFCAVFLFSYQLEKINAYDAETLLEDFNITISSDSAFGQLHSDLPLPQDVDSLMDHIRTYHNQNPGIARKKPGVEKDPNVGILDPYDDPFDLRPPLDTDDLLPENPTSWSSFFDTGAYQITKKLDAMQKREQDSSHNLPQFIKPNAARSRRADTGYFASTLEQGEMEGWHAIWTTKFFESGDSVGCLLPVATLAPAMGEVLRIEVAVLSGPVCRKLESRVERGDADLYDKPIMVTVITFTFDKIRVLQAYVGRPTAFYPSRDSTETPNMRPQTNISVRLSMDIDKVIGSDSDARKNWATVLSLVLFYSPAPHMERSEKATQLAGPAALTIRKKGALQTPSQPNGNNIIGSRDPSGTISERLFSGSEPNDKGDSSQSSQSSQSSESS